MVSDSISEVTGERGLDRDLRGVAVPDLTDHHDVRVGPQDGRQHRGEGQPGLGVHLDLVDAVQPVLDRVLDRDHVDLGLADPAQRGAGIECGGDSGGGADGDGPGLGAPAALVDLVDRAAGILERRSLGRATVDGLALLQRAGFDGIVLTWPRYVDGMRQFQTETFPLVQQAGLR